LGVQLINCAALLDVPDKSHVDESFGICGLGARVSISGKLENDLDGGRRGVRHPRELFNDKRFVGVFQGFAVLDGVNISA
jgi:hypothetical protein